LPVFLARVEYGALHNDRLEEALDISGGTDLWSKLSHMG